MSSLENEIKKTKEQIDNEINNVNILKEEIDFLNDISKEKIPMQYMLFPFRPIQLQWIL